VTESHPNVTGARRPAAAETILMAHGSGGQLGHELVEQVFLRHFHNDLLAALSDAAILDLAASQAGPGGKVGFTTDSYVISPLFFPGGDIGKLAVCGTVNDLAVAGAVPKYLSAGFIIEEGLAMATLDRVASSMADTARLAGVEIVTGDTKVVNRGAADGLFINTAGIGIVPPGLALAPANLRDGDLVIVSGTMGDHGMAIMMQREGLALDSALISDCAPLNGLIARLLDACAESVRCMRDPTRGGLVATLNEWATQAHVGIEIDEISIPLRPEVRGACEILGLDPLYVANEGKVVIAIDAKAASAATNALRGHPLGIQATIVGQITDRHPGRVTLRTEFGAQRILDMLVGGQLPRIC
jgi:hydrogenase expression/formation protein HypE